MSDITRLPIMTAADAESIGFARFNDVPTLPLDIPDGNFTITAKTSDGRRITFFFGEYRRGRRRASSMSSIMITERRSRTPMAAAPRSSTC